MYRDAEREEFPRNKVQATPQLAVAGGGAMPLEPQMAESHLGSRSPGGKRLNTTHRKEGSQDLTMLFSFS